MSSCLPFSFSLCVPTLFFFFFFNDTATTEIYTLSLHDALPILNARGIAAATGWIGSGVCGAISSALDRKSTRLNSSHGYISYAVFCLKKKKNTDEKQKCAQSKNALINAQYQPSTHVAFVINNAQ